MHELIKSLDLLLTFDVEEFTVSPNTLNNLGVLFYKGHEGIKQDKQKAREIFSFANRRGSWWAKYNLGICLINDEPKDVEEAYRLFSLLLRRLRPSLHEFKDYEHVIYYFSGLHYLNKNEPAKAAQYLNQIPKNSPHYKHARVKLMSLPIPPLVQGSFWMRERLSVASSVTLLPFEAGSTKVENRV